DFTLTVGSADGEHDGNGIRASKPAHAQVAVTHGAGELLAAVQLQAEVAGGGMHTRRFAMLQDLHAIHPGGDRRRIAGDARTHLVPVAGPPEMPPRIRQYWAGLGFVLV